MVGLARRQVQRVPIVIAVGLHEARACAHEADRTEGRKRRLRFPGAHAVGAGARVEAADVKEKVSVGARRKLQTRVVAAEVVVEGELRTCAIT